VKRALLVLMLLASRAHAQSGDYDPYSQAWNGMSSFVGLAEGMGFEVTAVSQLEWDELSSTDILVMVYPLQRVDPSDLTSFINAGGHAIIADDFGDSKEAMAALGLLRAESTVPQAATHWKGHLHAPIAQARAGHPLANDVGELVTNHPAMLTQLDGVTTIAGFENGAVVVAGERGSGRFVGIADPSILINKMLLFRGNVQLATNMLRWLDRNRRARRVVLLRGDTPMYGDPRPFIDDARAGELGRSIADLNLWSTSDAVAADDDRDEGARRDARDRAALDGAVRPALPPRPESTAENTVQPARRRDEPRPRHRHESRHRLEPRARLHLAHHVQVLVAGVTGKTEPLYTLSEGQLVNEVSRQRGATAGVALSRVYRRLRALPSRGQASAPWSAGHLARRDFDLLYRDVAELCRTLGAELPDDVASISLSPPSVTRKPPPMQQA
jgi:hypothetical protein